MMYEVELAPPAESRIPDGLPGLVCVRVVINAENAELAASIARQSVKQMGASAETLQVVEVNRIRDD
jgi:uncharacterized protein (UPF0212 family)